MHVLIHLAIAISVILLFGFQPIPAFVFILSSGVMDIDHLITEGKDIRKQSWKKYLFNFRESKKINYKTLQKSLHLFHTFEVILLLFMISIYVQIVFYIAFGFLIHLFTDGIGNVWNRNIKKTAKSGWLKYWFLSYYLAKRNIYNKV